MDNRLSVVWFRRDLRVHDQPALWHACRDASANVVGLYAFDPAEFEGKAFGGFPKTGAHRHRFILDSVADLRQSLAALGIPLIVVPTDVATALASLSIKAIFTTSEPGTEEQAQERAVRAVAASQGATVRIFAAASLVHPEDLPFRVDMTPDLFTTFRKQVEARFVVREPLRAPERRANPVAVESGELPALPSVPAPGFFLTGGETAARERLKDYIWTKDRLRVYKETRNGMLRADDGSRFSAALAQGCLSPRTIYAEVKRYERERVANDSTYWLIFELLWRDFFRFQAEKMGAQLYRQGGFQRLDLPWVDDAALLESWTAGRTGYPIVDAAMVELAATGYMSNRSRQIVASFLTKNLGLDWRLGAGWFESLLVDYDPYSNWGNWQYAAGVGHDAREFRLFNLKRQAEQYDADAAFVKHWLPMLRGARPDLAHEPWRDSRLDYPARVVDFDQSARIQRQAYERAINASGVAPGGRPRPDARRRQNARGAPGRR